VPEGDTIHRSALTLHRVLAGRVVTAFTTPLSRVETAARRHGVVGSRIDGVDARGKHLLLRFSCGVALHTHHRMAGSWHLYRTGSRWRKPSHEMRARIDAGDVVAVCFLSPVVEILTPDDEVRHPSLANLGPDLLGQDFDVEKARTRLRRRGDAEIGVALMDQGALAGIGNVYKSEVLFLCRVDPFASVSSLDDAALERLIREASTQLVRNVGRGGRRTTSPLARDPLWVYGRQGLRCRRCAGVIVRRRQGQDARSTYWCPACQPPL
jgi:endonuclease-8